MLERKCMKRADTTEVVLSILVAVMSIYLVLNLFGKNIQTVVENSGLYKVTHLDNEKKTAFEPMDTDPTKTQINVQIVADQGSLAELHGDAAATIERYETESHTETLTPENIMNLALQTTIFVASSETWTSSKKILQAPYFGNNPTKTYYDFTDTDCGIKVSYEPALGGTDFTTVVTKNGKYKIVKWGGQKKLNKEYYNDVYSSTTSASTTGANDAEGQNSPSFRVKNIEGIKKCFEEQYNL